MKTRGSSLASRRAFAGEIGSSGDTWEFDAVSVAAVFLPTFQKNHLHGTGRRFFRSLSAIKRQDCHPEHEAQKDTLPHRAVSLVFPPSQ
jgi:hypothetical protein